MNTVVHLSTMCTEKEEKNQKKKETTTTKISLGSVLTKGIRSQGPEAEGLIEEILKPHAWVKARVAQGMLTVLERYRHDEFFAHVCAQAAEKRVFNPKQVRCLLERERKQQTLQFGPPLSQRGRAMVRDINEYLN